VSGVTEAAPEKVWNNASSAEKDSVRGGVMKKVLIVLALVLVAAVGVLSAQSGAKKIYELTDEITAPRLLEAATPGYTDEAKKKNITGEVIVSIVVNEKGDVTEPKVKKGLGAGLDESSIEAVKIFKYKPGTKDDNPVNVRLDVSFNFYGQ
jgi:TonB family protein